MVEGIWNKIILWGLLMLFLFIFLFALYSKTGLISKITNFALGAERFLPSQPQKNLKQDESLPQSVIDVQKRFMDDLSKNPGQEKCLMSFNPISGLGDFRMTLSNYDGKIISRIGKPIGNGVTRNLNPVEDDNLQVCVTNPEGFYDCYFGPQKGQCTKPVYDALNSVEMSKDSVIIGKTTYNLGELVLFKPEKGKVCFINLDSKSFFWCTASGNCLDKIKSGIPECGKKLETSIPEEIQKGPKEEFERFVNFLQDLNLKSYQNFCTKTFNFDIDKMKTGFYIYAYTDGHLELKFNNQGTGELIESLSIKYIPYASISDNDELTFYFSNYDSLVDNFIINPAGDYSPSDLSGSIVQDSSIVAVNNINKWILSRPDRYLNGPMCKE